MEGRKGPKILPLGLFQRNNPENRGNQNSGPLDKEVVVLFQESVEVEELVFIPSCLVFSRP